VNEGWTAIILAGGDGTRLRDLTRRIAGDDRPKQFRLERSLATA
jgi:mannose-1-phosphate guanylyltransferase